MNTIDENQAINNATTTHEMSGREIKDGGFFARPHVRTDLGQSTAIDVPVRMPEDFAQLDLVDLGEGKEAGPVPIFIVRVIHPSTNEGSAYVVRPKAVDLATEMCEQGDPTYAVLTDKSMGFGGEVRLHELYPWISRTGQFGLWAIVTPLPGSVLSEHYYNVKADSIRANLNRWVRYTTINKEPVAQYAPATVNYPLKWPAEYRSGDWASIINRAFRDK
jgi:hypothetical protein